MDEVFAAPRMPYTLGLLARCRIPSWSVAAAHARPRRAAVAARPAPRLHVRPRCPLRRRGPPRGRAGAARHGPPGPSARCHAGRSSRDRRPRSCSPGARSASERGRAATRPRCRGRQVNGPLEVATSSSTSRCAGAASCPARWVRCRRCRACRWTSTRARRSGWSASPVRQVDRRAGDPAAAPADVGLCAVRRPGADRRCRSGSCATCAASCRSSSRTRTPRSTRGDRSTTSSPSRCSIHGSARAPRRQQPGRRAARDRRAQPRAPQPLPARVLRRPAAARRDRPGARARARA